MNLLRSLLILLFASTAVANDPTQAIQDAGISGGLVAQVDSDDLSLKALGERFHVRLLLPDHAATKKAWTAIEKAELQGRFTADVWEGKRLPLADRVLNALC
jgi:hypothetical protein